MNIMSSMTNLSLKIIVYRCLCHKQYEFLENHLIVIVTIECYFMIGEQF